MAIREGGGITKDPWSRLAAPDQPASSRSHNPAEGAQALLPVHGKRAVVRAKEYLGDFKPTPKPWDGWSDVAESKGAWDKGLTGMRRSIVANGVEYEVDCVIFFFFRQAASRSRRRSVGV